MNRRTLLRTFAVGTGLLATPTGPLSLLTATAEGTRFRNPLAIPPLETGVVRQDVRHFTLHAKTARTDFWPGSNTPTFGFNDQTYLGPTLELRRDENVAIRVENGLGETTTVHWHGMHLPAHMDGGPHQQIEPGGNWTAQFTVHQPAATLWYHSHQIHQTGPQVYAGMAGVMILRDKESERLDLPGDYGKTDIPLILQDRDFARDGRMIYIRHMHDIMNGKRGRNILVNGTLEPFVEVPAERIRFRILNGSNARTFNLGFEDDRPFLVIATDGGLLERPAGRQRLRLSPGERVEIIIDCADGKDAVLRSFPEEFWMGNRRVRSLDSFDLLSVRVRGQGTPAGVPARLVSIPEVRPESPPPVRRFVLEMAMGMRMMQGQGFTINGRTMDMNRIDLRVPVDTLERWNVDNLSAMPHPFHIHNVQFQIADRNGEVPPRHERGWKDTVLVDPGERVGLWVRFERYTDPRTAYMYHCHILEHEDRGMMGQFTVEEKSSSLS